MDLNEYQRKARDTAVYPAGIVWPTPDKSVIGLLYCVLGLAGESGEVANKTSKIIRDDKMDIIDVRRAQIKKELGDTLWYLANTCFELDFTLDEIAQANLDKLAERQARGMIHGDGDNR